jgi:seryl-tRNA synthetase
LKGEVPVLHEGTTTLGISKKHIHFELGNKIAGAGFPVYKEKERDYNALINYFLDKNTARL